MSYSNQGEMQRRSMILSGIFPDIKPISEAPDASPIASVAGSSTEAVDKERREFQEAEIKKLYKATDGHTIFLMKNPAFSPLAVVKKHLTVFRVPPVAVAKVSGGNSMKGFDYEIFNQQFLNENNIRSFASATPVNSYSGVRDYRSGVEAF